MSDRVRIPTESVRIAERTDDEEPEWDPVCYRVGLLVDEYFADWCNGISASRGAR